MQQVPKYPLPFAVSKSDGTVTLAFEYGLYEQPIVDWDIARSVAEKRCDAWGYKEAESFGVPQRICLSMNGYGECLYSRVTNLYQCIDRIKKSK